MTLEQYRQVLNALNDQIKALETERKSFVDKYKDRIDKQIEKRKKEDRKWFLGNFDIFWANRYKFGRDTLNGDIVIDFFTIYASGRNSIGAITISDLICLWDMGFKYQGYPVIECICSRVIWRLFYIKNGKMAEVKGLMWENLGFSPVLSGVLEYMSTHRRVFSVYDEYKTVQDMKNVLTN